MCPADRHNSLDANDALGDVEGIRQSSDLAPVAVYNCSRLGMQANPPGRSFGWFRRR